MKSCGRSFGDDEWWWEYDLSKIQNLSFFSKIKYNVTRDLCDIYSGHLPYLRKPKWNILDIRY